MRDLYGVANLVTVLVFVLREEENLHRSALKVSRGRLAMCSPVTPSLQPAPFLGGGPADFSAVLQNPLLACFKVTDKLVDLFQWRQSLCLYARATGAAPRPASLHRV
jgi:hypothetical protein